jgi:flagellar FliJ protein
MKSLDGQIRLASFRLADHGRGVARIEAMIAELDRRSSELEHDLNLEHGRTKINDPQHFAYSPLAKSLVQRRENLKLSIQGLHIQLKDAQSAASEALGDLTELQLQKERERPEEHANRSTYLLPEAIVQFS